MQYEGIGGERPVTPAMLGDQELNNAPEIKKKSGIIKFGWFTGVMVIKKYFI
jgi:hypothetical protein